MELKEEGNFIALGLMAKQLEFFFPTLALPLAYHLLLQAKLSHKPCQPYQLQQHMVASPTKAKSPKEM